MALDEWTGTIHAGRSQIGGETSGTVLETDSGTYDLEPANDDVRYAIAQLNGREAIVTGILQTEFGAERGNYGVILVHSAREVWPP